MDKEKKYYELAFLINDSQKFEELKKVLIQLKAEIFNEGEVKNINLTYPVKKQTKAYFGYLNFKIEPDRIIEIDQQLKFLNFLLRFMIMKMNKYYLKTLLKDEGENKEIKEELEEKKQNNEKDRLLDFNDNILTNEALEKKIEEILNK